MFVRYQMLLGSGYKAVPKIDTAPTLKELSTCNAESWLSTSLDLESTLKKKKKQLHSCQGVSFLIFKKDLLCF